MFKIVQNRTFTHAVKVAMPIDGGYAEETLKVTYNYLDSDEARTFDLKTAEGSAKFLDRAVVRFDDLTDENGQPLAYSAEVRKAVLGMPNAWNAVVNGYFIAVGKSAEGN